MSDLISRQAAIDAIHEDIDWLAAQGGRDLDLAECMERAKSILENLPSAQPERLTDDDFETIRIHLNAQKEKLCNQQRWEDAEEYQRIIDRFMAFASEEPEPKKGEWTTEEVAELLFNIFGDDCACNFNGIDEWLPERCKYTEIAGECPNPKEKHGCWMQFLLQGGADMRGEEK